MDLSDIGDVVHREIAASVPDFDALVRSAVTEVRGFVGRVHASSPRPAVLSLTTQVVNDFEDLAFDLQRGRGRSALRTTRVLFDALLSMLDVLDTGSDAAARYEDHYAVTNFMAAKMRSGVDGLTGSELRSEEHRRKKAARIHRAKHDEALEMWGRNFRRNWTPDTTYDRAVRHGLADGYDLFRVASSTIHASAGGGVGLIHEVNDQAIYRTGPALELCPIALGDGTRFFELSLAAVGPHLGLDVSRTITAIAELRSTRNAYTKAMRALDNQLWPAESEPGTVVVRSLLPNGERRWILHDNQMGKIVTCTDPANTDPAQVEMIDQRLDQVELTGLHRTEWVNVVLQGATAEPLPEAH